MAHFVPLHHLHITYRTGLFFITHPPHPTPPRSHWRWTTLQYEPNHTCNTLNSEQILNKSITAPILYIYNETWQFECKFVRMQTCLKCGFAFWNMYLIKHNAKGGGGDPGDGLDLFCWLEVIHCWVCFVLAGAASLKIKLAKQINHMMRRLADCCYSLPPLHFYWHFFPPSLLKLQLSRHKGPCGLDQMFQAAHFPTLCLMEYSWATRHRSTAPCRTDQSPLIY